MQQEHDLSWMDAVHSAPQFLGDIFALVFVRGLTPHEAMVRVGGLEDTSAQRTPAEIRETHDYDHGYPEIVAAFALGEWAVLVQPTSYVIGSMTDALSRGTEAVAVVRHDYASPGFTHAVDGEVVAHFNPEWPDERSGDLDRLLPLMREAGFGTDPVDDDDEDEDWDSRYDEPMTRSLRLAGLITGVVPTFEQVSASLPSMHLDRLFSRTRPEHIEDAHATAAMLVAELDLADTPGLTAALAADAPVVVTPDSDLGRHLREWSEFARRASWTQNHERSRMTDAERTRGYRFGHLLLALAATFRSDLSR
ncbi:DUF6461 domain-containing protein [Lentzea sp. NPDC055074]